MTEQTWQHRGVSITFDTARAIFLATIDGKPQRAPSLDAIKKKIEAAVNNAFTPWRGLSVSYYGAAFREVEVVGIAKGRKEWLVRYLDRDGRRSEGNESAIVEDTPENRSLVAAMVAAHKTLEAEKDRLGQIKEDARKAIPFKRVE